jgi:hypothetical protein
MTDPKRHHWIGMDSSGGRIGPFWWINADTRPIAYFGPDLPIRFVMWGTCGFDVSRAEVHLHPIDEPC